jgi:hypothetical protein
MLSCSTDAKNEAFISVLAYLLYLKINKTMKKQFIQTSLMFAAMLGISPICVLKT